MADLNKELDLNVPAAPSLTLDAAPSLTLDPMAEEKAEEEAPKAEPVRVEDTPLSPEEQKMVDDFAEKIDITNSQLVLQYGAASQKKLSDFSETALSRVKTKDMGETGELITSLITELKDFDANAEQPKGILGFFKKAGSNIEQLKTRYDSADKNVERIRRTVNTVGLVALISGIFLLFLGWVGARSILTWMGTPPDVLPDAVMYLRVYFLGMPFIMIFNFGSAILRSVGDTRRPCLAP